VVSPANSLVASVPDKTIRVVVNRDPVGAELGINYDNENKEDTTRRDFFAQGDCDTVFLELIKELGWLDDINAEELPPESAALVQKARQDTAYTKWF